MLVQNSKTQAFQAQHYFILSTQTVSLVFALWNPLHKHWSTGIFTLKILTKQSRKPEWALCSRKQRIKLNGLNHLLTDIGAVLLVFRARSCDSLQKLDREKNQRSTSALNDSLPLLAWWNPNILPALKGGSRRKQQHSKGQSMEQEEKEKRNYCSQICISFSCPWAAFRKAENWKRKEKKTAYFDKGAVFTLGSLVKLLLLPTAYVENPEGKT